MSAQRDCLAGGYLSQGGVTAGGAAAKDTEAIPVTQTITAVKFHQD